MGNCIRHESQMQWGGEDWNDVLMTKDEKLAMEMEEKLGIGGGGGGGMKMMDSKKFSRSSKMGSTEVKIKITKKQWEKLIRKVEVDEKDGLSVEQVLLQLMKLDAHIETQHRSWRPRLQSIPEVL